MQWRLLHASPDVDVQGLMRLSCQPTLGLRGGETAVISFHWGWGGGVASCGGSANFPQHICESSKSSSGLVLWTVSTRVRVDLIRNLSDTVAKIAFISGTMMNVKGITLPPPPN